MFYLIEYDRERGKLLSLRKFDALDASGARAARLTLEIDLVRQGIAREVVLLEAASDEDLKRTHRRYFAGVEELAPTDVAS